MQQTFMKEKPVLPLLMSMSLPMVVSMLVNSLYNIVDSFFVAQISEDAMTALSLVYPVQNFINAAAIGFGVGINSVIAYYLGAGNARLPIPQLRAACCFPRCTALRQPCWALRPCRHSCVCSRRMRR